MKRVTGIGGIFFKAKDPAALRAWYQKHLGVDVQSWGGAAFQWTDDAGNAYKGTTIWNIGDAQPTALDVPRGTLRIDASAINDAGWIVGTGFNGANDSAGFLWRDGVLTALTDLLPPDTGWRITTAHDINDNNDIVGMAERMDDDSIRIGVILKPSR